MHAQQTVSPSSSGHPDYSLWSIEELWQLAAQMRVAGARTKSRRELIELFAVPAAEPVGARGAKRKDKELS